jgi:hypothetical protein
MHDIALQSGWETFLLVAPLVGLLLVGIFRLDTRVASPKQQRDQPHLPSDADERGHMLLGNLE